MPTNLTSRRERVRLADKPLLPTWLQRQSTQTPEVESVHAAANQLDNAGPGKPLEPEARAYLEPRFGHSFSNIRIHDDGQADDLARSVGARAFTSGSHIFMSAGTYAPSSADGMQLLAHEAVHTIQQSEGPVSGRPLADGVTVSDPADPFEQTAESAAQEAVR